MLDTGVGIATMVLVCAAFLYLGLSYAGRARQSVEEYTVSRNHAPVNVGIATLVASLFGTWVLLSPGETGANFGIVSLAGYAVGMACITVLFMFVGPRIRRLMPNGHSLTEYVKHRFGMAVFVAISLVIIFVIGIFITAEMTGISTAIHILTGTPRWATSLAVGVVVVAYTAYGGLRVSIYTDRIQFWVLMPAMLLMVIVAAVVVSGNGAWTQASESGLFSAKSSGSYFFGVVLIIGIVASNAFHPGLWQRVYTVESQKVLNRSLWGATAIAIPLTFLLGMAGIAAVGNGSVEPFAYPEVSAALFALASDVFPLWMHFLMLVCALMLGMSTLDTLMNGLASGLAADMGVSRQSLMLQARAVTVVVAIPAVVVAAQGFSVLYVFLFADLLGAAIAVPMLTGLYSTRMPGWAVLLAGAVGTFVGALFYPRPDLVSPMILSAPNGEQMFWSFALALAVSSAITAGVVLLRRISHGGDEYDFARLQTEVRLIDEPTTGSVPLCLVAYLPEQFGDGGVPDGLDLESELVHSGHAEGLDAEYSVLPDQQSAQLVAEVNHQCSRPSSSIRTAPNVIETLRRRRQHERRKHSCESIPPRRRLR